MLKCRKYGGGLIVKILVFVLALGIAMTACSRANKSVEDASSLKVAEEQLTKDQDTITRNIDGGEGLIAEAAIKAGEGFASSIVNDNPAIEGGVLRFGMAADSGFAGVLNPAFYTDVYDYRALWFFTEPLIGFDKDFVADQYGAATFTYDIDASTLTLTVRDNVKWHDGLPVTADDLLFAYEVIAHPTSTSMRLNENMRNIVGVNEYSSGEADVISGLVLTEDKMSLTISFIEFFPSILVNGFWSEPLPRHYLGDIPVEDMAGHTKSRLEPMGFGAFKVSNVVPGESVEYVRFDDYWRGKPVLDGVRLEVINPAMAPIAMKEGYFDILDDFDVMFYPDYPNPTNYVYLGELMMVFNYTGFKLGYWDWDSNKNVVDPKAKMANRQLRQAIGYAIDNDVIGETIWNGLRFRATTPITPKHSGYQNTDLKGYYYNPDLARRLLAQAGYIDIDGDGFRESPDGNPFTIYWANMEGTGADTIAQFKIQQWAEVGLRVELVGGRLMEYNAFYDAVEDDDPRIDMYDAAWNTGFNPSPGGLWGSNSPANYTRYHTPVLVNLMADINSERAWSQDFLTERYKAWQREFLEDPPAIPTIWRVQLVAVNNRVKNYTLDYTVPSLHLWALTAGEPYRGR